VGEIKPESSSPVPIGETDSGMSPAQPHCKSSHVQDCIDISSREDEDRGEEKEDEDIPIAGITHDAHDAAAHFDSHMHSDSEGSDVTDLPIGLQLCFGSVLEVWDNTFFHQSAFCISQDVDF
jgi:hypothetical protein